MRPSARLIQAEGLDGKSAAEVAASVADALDELHRLQRSLIDEFDASRDAPKIAGASSWAPNPGDSALDAFASAAAVFPGLALVNVAQL
jgi:hypothetical protein